MYLNEIVFEVVLPFKLATNFFHGIWGCTKLSSSTDSVIAIRKKASHHKDNGRYWRLLAKYNVETAEIQEPSLFSKTDTFSFRIYIHYFFLFQKFWSDIEECAHINFGW